VAEGSGETLSRWNTGRSDPARHRHVLMAQIGNYTVAPLGPSAGALIQN
jgi:hypothetical protein